MWVNRFANAGDAAFEAAEIAMERVYIYIYTYCYSVTLFSDMVSPHLDL